MREEGGGAAGGAADVLPPIAIPLLATGSKVKHRILDKTQYFQHPTTDHPPPTSHHPNILSPTPTRDRLGSDELHVHHPSWGGGVNLPGPTSFWR